MRENVIIIGNGPAAFVASIYAATANLNPLVLLHPSNNPIECLDSTPGILQEISKEAYINNLRAQAERFNVKFVENKVLKVSCDTIIKITTSVTTYITKTIILEDLQLCHEIFTKDDFYDEKVKCTNETTVSRIKGVFVCGSAREKYDDAVILCGSGCMAALDAKEYIENHF